MKKLKECTISEWNPKKQSYVKLQVTMNKANTTEINKGHLAYIAKIEDSIYYESNNWADVKSKMPTNGEAMEYCIWHRLIPMRDGGILAKYRFEDADKVFKSALESSGFKVDTSEYKMLKEFLKAYNGTTREDKETYNKLRNDAKYLEIIKKFSSKYFIK